MNSEQHGYIFRLSTELEGPSIWTDIFLYARQG